MTGDIQGPLIQWHADTAAEDGVTFERAALGRDASGRVCMDYVTAGILGSAAWQAWQGIAYHRRVQEILSGPDYDATYTPRAVREAQEAESGDV